MTPMPLRVNKLVVKNVLLPKNARRTTLFKAVMNKRRTARKKAMRLKSLMKATRRKWRKKLMTNTSHFKVNPKQTNKL
jgi:predicted GIY-YIG superfamily endonuclease